MNNAFWLVRTSQVGGLFSCVPKIYDRDCSFIEVRGPANIVIACNLNFPFNS